MPIFNGEVALVFIRDVFEDVPRYLLSDFLRWPPKSDETGSDQIGSSALGCSSHCSHPLSTWAAVEALTGSLSILSTAPPTASLRWNLLIAAFPISLKSDRHSLCAGPIERHHCLAITHSAVDLRFFRDPIASIQPSHGDSHIIARSLLLEVAGVEATG
ncbi:hypothetical protein TIFTF001_038128 [Ficus carica]|uniref:Uncharacterized protein n=1 Tax=Ficus carica TaxID=3494 RepID=A0AA88E7I9_FICCA|nr:hypothetical protein TIFTF001_038128 [Ficus carica]